MKEAAFLRANADKWKRFEALLNDSKPGDPDELARLFIELTDDLSYARTYYPRGKTEAYLNQLTATSHRKIYRNRAAEPGWFRRFWREDVPHAVSQARGALGVSAAIFLIAMGIGVVSSLGDQTFVRLIMGDAYVELTMQNIEAGDPMAIYKQSAKLDMFLGITVNNIMVAFRAFVFGVLTPIATGYVLLVNGVMLGAFHTMFHGEGILWESLLVVYIHGALEIPAIIVAGAAGITMGSGFLFPGTYSRLHAFRLAARRGFTIVLGLVPVFAVAGFLEGFVTRHTDMPIILSLAIILGSLTFITWYFLYIPLQLRHKDDI